MNFTQALQWRYAPKQLNGNAVPASTLGRIIDAAHLAPSSYGLQPYSVIVVQNKNLLNQIFLKACPQAQIQGSSELLVFASKTQVNDELVDNYIRGLADAKKQPEANFSEFSSAMKAAINSMESNDAKKEWANRQAYISLGLAVSAAALEKVDAAPMEGFDPEALDDLLGLKEQGLSSVVLLALGYRDEDDSYAKQPKWRKPYNEFIQWR
ncbi:NAD(P)H-dependent oxidoreductase [Bermanella marisrubri]|nr:NAD(P)H-dependent oxidoreductase [Bermanella marisrubri]